MLVEEKCGNCVFERLYRVDRLVLIECACELCDRNIRVDMRVMCVNHVI